MKFSVLERYLGVIILRYTLLAMLVLLGLFTFVTFLEELGDLGRGNYDLGALLAYIALTVPRTTYELFPMAALLGTMSGLSLLANDSELVALRASGVSIAQISVAALKTATVFVLAAMLIGELVVPSSEIRAERGRALALAENASSQAEFWNREQRVFFHAAEIRPDLSLKQVKIFALSEDWKLQTLVDAARAEYRDGHWHLSQVKQTQIGKDGRVQTAHAPSRAWQSRITPQTLAVFLAQPEQLSLWQLRRHSQFMRQNNQRATPYELAFWNKLFLPFSAAVMVALAIPFVFVNLRSGNLGRSLFFGTILGLGFYASYKGFGYVVLATALSPLLGSILPVLGFLAVAVVMTRKVS